MNKFMDTGFAVRRAALLLVTTLLTGGCAALNNSRDHANMDPVRDAHDRPRAERVFLFQSHIANALMDRYPLMEILDDAGPAVVNAEAHMTESCSPLTQAVLADLQGEKPSFGLRWRALSTIGECERAAQKMEALLSSVGLAGSI
jgi:hypothetical protein